MVQCDGGGEVCVARGGWWLISVRVSEQLNGLVVDDGGVSDGANGDWLCWLIVVDSEV